MDNLTQEDWVTLILFIALAAMFCWRFWPFSFEQEVMRRIEVGDTINLFEDIPAEIVQKFTDHEDPDVRKQAAESLAMQVVYSRQDERW